MIETFAAICTVGHISNRFGRVHTAHLVLLLQQLVAVGDLHRLQHRQLLIAVLLLDQQLALVVRPAPLAQLVGLQAARQWTVACQSTNSRQIAWGMVIRCVSLDNCSEPQPQQGPPIFLRASPPVPTSNLFA